MSAPLSQLVISVKIDQTTDLGDLHKMLKQLENQGGEIKIDKSDLEQLSTLITEQSRRIVSLVSAITSLEGQFPGFMDRFQSILDFKFGEIFDLFDAAQANWEKVFDFLSRDLSGVFSFSVIDNVKIMKERLEKLQQEVLKLNKTNKTEEILKKVNQIENSHATVEDFEELKNWIEKTVKDVTDKWDMVTWDVFNTVSSLKNVLLPELKSRAPKVSDVRKVIPKELATFKALLDSNLKSVIGNSFNKFSEDFDKIGTDLINEVLDKFPTTASDDPAEPLDLSTLGTYGAAIIGGIASLITKPFPNADQIVLKRNIERGLETPLNDELRRVFGFTTGRGQNLQLFEEIKELVKSGELLIKINDRVVSISNKLDEENLQEKNDKKDSGGVSRLG